MENFEVIKILGRGNYGQAILVKDLRLPEPAPDDPNPESNLFVVKRVDLSGMPEPERKQAKQEVVLLKALQHPSIVHYYDSFIQDGHLCIVMELCSRGDLGSMIKAARKAGKHFSEEQILDWFSQLAFALAFIHRKRILHRDIKSSNVFITRANTCRLGDFGIARVLAHTMDAARTVLGTPFYLSPESVQGKPYNEKSDIWALGCVLYELASLQHAFNADNLLGLVYKIVQEKQAPLPEKLYSSRLQSLVDALLSKNASDRYDAEDILALPFIAERLQRLATMEGTTAGLGSPVLIGSGRGLADYPSGGASADRQEGEGDGGSEGKKHRHRRRSGSSRRSRSASGSRSASKHRHFQHNNTEVLFEGQEGGSSERAPGEDDDQASQQVRRAPEAHDARGGSNGLNVSPMPAVAPNAARVVIDEDRPFLFPFNGASPMHGGGGAGVGTASSRPGSGGSNTGSARGGGVAMGIALTPHGHHVTAAPAAAATGGVVTGLPPAPILLGAGGARRKSSPQLQNVQIAMALQQQQSMPPAPLASPLDPLQPPQQQPAAAPGTVQTPRGSLTSRFLAQQQQQQQKSQQGNSSRSTGDSSRDDGRPPLASPPEPRPTLRGGMSNAVGAAATATTTGVGTGTGTGASMTTSASTMTTSVVAATVGAGGGAPSAMSIASTEGKVDDASNTALMVGLPGAVGVAVPRRRPAGPAVFTPVPEVMGVSSSDEVDSGAGSLVSSITTVTTTIAGAPPSHQQQQQQLARAESAASTERPLVRAPSTGAQSSFAIEPLSTSSRTDSSAQRAVSSLPSSRPSSADLPLPETASAIMAIGAETPAIASAAPARQPIQKQESKDDEDDDAGGFVIDDDDEGALPTLLSGRVAPYPRQQPQAQHQPQQAGGSGEKDKRRLMSAFPTNAAVTADRSADKGSAASSRSSSLAMQRSFTQQQEQQQQQPGEGPDSLDAVVSRALGHIATMTAAKTTPSASSLAAPVTAGMGASDVGNGSSRRSSVAETTMTATTSTASQQPQQAQPQVRRASSIAAQAGMRALLSPHPQQQQPQQQQGGGLQRGYSQGNIGGAAGLFEQPSGPSVPQYTQQRPATVGHHPVYGSSGGSRRGSGSSASSLVAPSSSSSSTSTSVFPAGAGAVTGSSAFDTGFSPTGGFMPDYHASPSMGAGYQPYGLVAMTMTESGSQQSLEGGASGGMSSRRALIGQAQQGQAGLIGRRTTRTGAPLVSAGPTFGGSASAAAYHSYAAPMQHYQHQRPSVISSSSARAASSKEEEDGLEIQEELVGTSSAATDGSFYYYSGGKGSGAAARRSEDEDAPPEIITDHRASAAAASGAVAGLNTSLASLASSTGTGGDVSFLMSPVGDAAGETDLPGRWKRRRSASRSSGGRNNRNSSRSPSALVSSSLPFRNVNGDEEYGDADVLSSGGRKVAKPTAMSPAAEAKEVEDEEEGEVIAATVVQESKITSPVSPRGRQPTRRTIASPATTTSATPAAIPTSGDRGKSPSNIPRPSAHTHGSHQKPTQNELKDLSTLRAIAQVYLNRNDASTAQPLPSRIPVRVPSASNLRKPAQIARESKLADEVGDTSGAKPALQRQEGDTSLESIASAASSSTAQTEPLIVSPILRTSATHEQGLTSVVREGFDSPQASALAALKAKAAAAKKAKEEQQRQLLQQQTGSSSQDALGGISLEEIRRAFVEPDSSFSSGGGVDGAAVPTPSSSSLSSSRLRSGSRTRGSITGSASRPQSSTSVAGNAAPIAGTSSSSRSASRGPASANPSAAIAGGSASASSSAGSSRAPSASNTRSTSRGPSSARPISGSGYGQHALRQASTGAFPSGGAPTPSNVAVGASASSSPSTGVQPTRVFLERMRAQGRRILGPLLFDRVYGYLRDQQHAAGIAVAGRSAGPTGGGSSAGQGREHLQHHHPEMRQAVAARLRAIVGGDQRLYDECKRVDELVFLEGILSSSSSQLATQSQQQSHIHASSSAAVSTGHVSSAEPASAGPVSRSSSRLRSGGASRASSRGAARAPATSAGLNVSAASMGGATSSGH